MATFKIVVAYDGTGYVGWQRQPTGTSIQGLLEDAVRELDPRGPGVHGAGRTDAGVHALAQVASFALDRAIDPDTLTRALNARLPEAVRVMRAELVPADFHARFASRAKTYRYRMWDGAVLSPFETRYAWHVMVPLDADAMDRAARRLEGEHDFAAFQGTGSDAATTTRTVYSARVTRSSHDPRAPSPDLITLEISGDGFLRHMVRNIAGTLVEIGRGRRRPEWIDEVLAGKDRALAGRNAPACGLFLVAVDYGAAALAAEPNAF